MVLAIRCIQYYKPISKFILFLYCALSKKRIRSCEDLSGYSGQLFHCHICIGYVNIKYCKTGIIRRSKFSRYRNYSKLAVFNFRGGQN